MNYQPVRVFCLEMVMREPVTTLNDFSAWIEEAVSMARAHYPRKTPCHILLTFPEFTSLPLIYDEETFYTYSEVCYSYFAGLARHEKAYVLASLPTVEKERLFNTAFLSNPEGAVVLETKKQALTFDEEAIGFTASREVSNVVELPFGKVGIAICLDAFKAEYIHELKSQGAQIVLQPSANPQPWDQPAEGSGVWQPLEWTVATVGAVEPMNHPITYLINPMLRGMSPLGHLFDGQSAIVQANAELHACPYVGVEQAFQAQFVYCSDYGESDSHQVGWVDLTPGQKVAI